MASISFYGAAGTVTGSKFLLDTGDARVLLDCGLFQGPKVWRERNWAPPVYLEGGLDAVVLTHAHLDHSGYLPRLLAMDQQLRRRRPEWRVYTTPATVDLLRVMLPDSAHLQEEDAAFANKKKFSKHDPALPLYTTAEAYAALRLLRPRDYDERWEAAPGLSAQFEDAGHIIGSATVRFTLPDNRTVLFSGDLGRYVNPLLRDPTPPGDADVVVMESTYGGRQHSPEPPEQGLEAAVHEAVTRGGVLLIPAFAVGRTQDLLYALRHLMLSGRIPELPIFVDSPMAIEATRIFLAHEEGQDPTLRARSVEGRQRTEALRWSAEGGVRYTQTRAESQALNDLDQPAIIISASGMATGGRILHHLKHRLPRKSTVVLLAGYQAEGTRGRLLLDGAKSLKMHGEEVPVRAAVRFVDGFSAHADEPELLRWLSGFTRPPRRLFLVHGEPDAAEALAAAIKRQLGWTAEIPQYGERLPL
ncbi:MAG TPA: MBL fold metallo-hydrolase [Chloroflexota bacterium]|nr:MBL fold metallo-hydrolase [Chloroflexota bacterium]